MALFCHVSWREKMQLWHPRKPPQPGGEKVSRSFQTTSFPVYCPGKSPNLHKRTNMEDSLAYLSRGFMGLLLWSYRAEKGDDYEFTDCLIQSSCVWFGLNTHCAICRPLMWVLQEATGAAGWEQGWHTSLRFCTVGVSLNYSLTCTSRHTSSQSVDESSVVPDHIRAAVSFGGFSQVRCGNLSVQLSSVVLCRPLWRSWWGKNTFRFSLYMKHLCLESENSDSHPSVLPAELIELQNVDRTVIKDQFVPSSIKILNSSS